MLQINMANGVEKVNEKDSKKLKRIAKNWFDDIGRITGYLTPELRAEIFDTRQTLRLLIDSKIIGLAKLSWLYDYSRKGLVDTLGIETEIIMELTEVFRVCNKYLVVNSCFE